MRAISIARNETAARQDRAAGMRGPHLALVHMSREPARSSPDAIHLTGRQMEVLALLCEGLPNKLICRRLNIAAGTVKAHISSILRELGASSRLQAVVCARRYGLLEEFDRQEEESAERGAAAASERSANGSSAAPSGVRALN